MIYLEPGGKLAIRLAQNMRSNGEVKQSLLP